ncbi:outer membrane protein assembly factor BamB family protein [Haladaptatus sp. CMSO5]|uniref:outer membrane protein assembly factor BamB family protein n=1 Tax=Haladaptatus sp. CMSO5 TaxID=3120514 RepID=UPI002FCE1AED
MPRSTRRTILKALGLTAGVAGIGSANALLTRADEHASTGWSTFQYDAGNTGFVPDSLDLNYPIANSTVEIDPKNDERPAIVDGVAYVAGFDIQATDLETGELLWEQSYDSATHQIGSDKSPTVSDDTLILSGGGVVSALSTQDGSVLWQFDTGEEDTSSTTVVDGTVYFTTDTGWCYALALEDGSRVWSYETGGSIGTDSSYGIPSVEAGLVFIATTLGVFALDAETGEMQWNKAVSFVAPVASDGALFLAADEELVSVDATTGEERWRVTVDDDVSVPPVVSDGGVFVRRQSGAVDGYDAADGSLRWSIELLEDYRVPMTGAGDTLYVPSGADLYQQLVAIDTETGEERWRYYVTDMEVYNPYGLFIDDGTPYFLSHYNYLYELVEGPRSLDWRFFLGEHDYGNPDPYLFTVSEPLVASEYGVYTSQGIAVEAEKGGPHWEGKGGKLEVDDGAYYTALGRGLTALDFITDDGLFGRQDNQRWQQLFEKNLTTAPLSDGSMVYAGSEFKDQAASLYAVDATTGEQQWEFTGKSCPGMATVEADPVFLGETVLAGTSDALWALDRAEGGVAWVANTTVSQLASNATHAFTAGDGMLTSFDDAGESVWETMVAGTVSGLAATETHVFATIAPAEQVTQLAAFDAATGERLWAYTPVEEILTEPLATDATVYVGAGNTIRALNPEDGTERRQYDAQAEISVTPALTDTALYVATEAGYIYKFERTE